MKRQRRAEHLQKESAEIAHKKEAEPVKKSDFFLHWNAIVVSDRQQVKAEGRSVK